MRVVAVIPARMGSSRFPGKPLATLCGLPMIQHVYERTRMCKGLDAVYIATCDQEIMAAAKSFGAPAEMTSSKHERASDRMAEVAQRIPADIYVLVQGDEPMLAPEMIELSLTPFADPAVVCANLAAPIRTVEEFEDRNCIKVVIDRKGDALYFSREPVPTRARMPFGRIPAYKQVCIIPFRRDFLLTYTALDPTPIEQAESIDMLRAMEHGYSIRLVKSDFPTYSVDTPQDLARVEKLLWEDPLLPRYAKSR